MNNETREHKVKEKIENNDDIGHVVSDRHLNLVSNTRLNMLDTMMIGSWTS